MKLVSQINEILSSLQSSLKTALEEAETKLTELDVAANDDDNDDIELEDTEVDTEDVKSAIETISESINTAHERITNIGAKALSFKQLVRSTGARIEQRLEAQQDFVSRLEARLEATVTSLTTVTARIDKRLDALEEPDDQSEAEPRAAQLKALQFRMVQAEQQIKALQTSMETKVEMLLHNVVADRVHELEGSVRTNVELVSSHIGILNDRVTETQNRLSAVEHAHTNLASQFLQNRDNVDKLFTRALRDLDKLNKAIETVMVPAPPIKAGSEVAISEEPVTNRITIDYEPTNGKFSVNYPIHLGNIGSRVIQFLNSLHGR